MDWILLIVVAVLIVTALVVVIVRAVSSRGLGDDPLDERTKREIADAQAQHDKAKGDLGDMGGAGMG